MAKKILVVYAKSTQELMNRQSALGSYIFCLCEILQKNRMVVAVNGIRFEELAQQVFSPSRTHQASVGNLKTYFPTVVKEFLKDVFVFKKMKHLYQQIESSGAYDIVLEFYTYASDIGYNISSRQGIPLVLVYDSPVLEEFIFFNGNKLFFKGEILKRELKTLLRAKSVVVYSNAVKDYLNKLSSKTLNIFIHQNVDYTRFDFFEKQLAAHPIKIGFIGSFLKWHRIDLLLEAFCKLRKENYNIELFLVGFGMEYDRIKAKVDKSICREYITMTGFMDGSQLVEIKKMLHVGVMPGSNWYGAPNKIFEYGAAQMAVVAPDTPTISDLFEGGKELLLFKQDDVDELYDKLKLLCDDPVLIKELGAGLQQKIKNAYSENITFEFYNALLG